ncbi:MAG: hypothetical protein GF368_04155 [Candidatus Aenigmarchaeota archaeon]|nr:hypothetical protein [Candidatus Aenigmarchaeota archaeon]
MRRIEIITLVSIATLFLSNVAVMGIGGIQESTFPIDIGQPPSDPPEVHLIERWVDIGIDVSQESINPSDFRTGQYAFTGEQLYYTVLVRDMNGADDIIGAEFAIQEDGMNGEGWSGQALCNEILDPETYCDTCFTNWCDKLTNLQFNADTDKVFDCILTVEAGWLGDGKAKVRAYDINMNEGETPFETWTVNPELSVTVVSSDGEGLTFSGPQEGKAYLVDEDCVRDQLDLDPLTRDCAFYAYGGQQLTGEECEVSFTKNKLLIKNNAQKVNMWAFIAGSNFYDNDPNHVAMCPNTNQLDINQFEYRAMSGSWDSGWRVMPEYNQNIVCSGPSIWDTCRGGCRIPTGMPPLDILTPGNQIEVQLKVVWPKTCIGTFDNGSITAIVRAV